MKQKAKAKHGVTDIHPSIHLYLFEKAAYNKSNDNS